MYRIFLNFAKSCVLSCLSNVSNTKNFTMPFLKYKRLKLKLRVFLAGHSVAMVTYCVTKLISTCSPVIGQLFYTMIVASSDKEWSIMNHQVLCLGKYWKLLRATLSQRTEIFESELRFRYTKFKYGVDVRL